MKHILIIVLLIITLCIIIIVPFMQCHDIRIAREQMKLDEYNIQKYGTADETVVQEHKEMLREAVLARVAFEKKLYDLEQELLKYK